MKKLLSICTLSLLLLWGCGIGTKHKAELGFNEFKDLVHQAIEGNVRANDTLTGLIDLALPINTNYNKLDFDTLIVGKSKYYAVLLEYPNPALNRFAVYDSKLHQYILDKSLNGNVNLQRFEFLTIGVFGVMEEFAAKDALYLKRLSLYRVTKDSLNLALRVYTELFSPTVKMEQSVVGITENAVYTKLSIPAALKVEARADTFFLDNKSSNYVSNRNVFEALVSAQIDSFKNEGKYSQIKDPASLNSSIKKDETEGKKPAGYAYYTHQYDKFRVYIPSDWKIDNNKKMEKTLKKETSGAYFYDGNKGSSLFVARMKGNETTEEYVPEPYNETVVKYITVKSTRRIETKETITQYFEVSCGTFRYVVMLQAQVEVYNSNRNIFEYIIRSFGVECNE